METPPPTPLPGPWQALRRVMRLAIALNIWLILWTLLLSAGALFSFNYLLTAERTVWGESHHEAAIIFVVTTSLVLLHGGIILKIFQLVAVSSKVSPEGDPRSYATGFAHAWRLPRLGAAAPDDPTESVPTILARARPAMLTVAIILGLMMLGYAGFFAYQAIRDYHSHFHQAYRGWRVPAMNIALALYAAIACFELLRAARKLGPDEANLPAVLEHHRRFWKHFTLANFFLAVELTFNGLYSAVSFCG